VVKLVLPVGIAPTFGPHLAGLSQLEAIVTRKCLKISKTAEKVSPTKCIF
jgi:hypothetical protein